MPVSVLEKKLNELIARDEGVSPDKITSEFIHERRDSRARIVSVDLTPSQYGGHDGTGLDEVTPAKMEEEEREADDFLSQFVASEKP